MFMIVFTKVDLPQPDSPTMAKVSPRSTSMEMPLQARKVEPSARGNSFTIS